MSWFVRYDGLDRTMLPCILQDGYVLFVLSWVALMYTEIHGFLFYTFFSFLFLCMYAGDDVLIHNFQIFQIFQKLGKSHKH